MIDINATNFYSDFDLTKATVGVVGYGYVGKAVEHFFAKQENHCRVLIYDKAKPELGTLDQVVKESEVVFVCVPTPMKKSGECFTGIVGEVISDIRRASEKVERPTDQFVIVIKSTVKPGFTAALQKKNPDLRIVFSPEFLTEKNSIGDFQSTNRILFGGDQEDAGVVSKFFSMVQPKRVESDRLLLLQCDPTVAEMVKLFTNGILMTKVLFANEVYQVCKAMGVDYKEVQVLSTLDHRIGKSHTSVPGHDGQLGAGGHCFPKDINNLRFVAKELGIPEKMFTAVIDRNLELREDKDWERMKDRAVIDA